MFKKTSFFVSLLLLNLTQTIHAQDDFGYNYLPENIISAVEKPNNYGQIARSKYWLGIPNHEPDLVNKSTFYPDGIERHYEFENYIGLRLYDPEKKNNQSYATIRLKHPLKKGQRYKIYMGGFFPYSTALIEKKIRQDLKIRTESQFQINYALVRKRTADFTKIPIGYALAKTRPQNLEEAKKNNATEIISSKGFFKFYSEFIATEDSEYLTIGNFLQDKQIPKETLFDIEKYALIFQISITESEKENLIPNGDFESFANPPTRKGQWWRLDDWFNPHPNREHNKDEPSPDIITKKIRDVKNPLRGEGSGRVGYINMDTIIFNEGLGIKLKNKLEKGKKYALSFNVGSTNRITNQFVSRKRTHSDLDSLKVQFGFSHAKPEQGKGKFLYADQLLQYSQYLSFLFTNKVVMLTFTAQDDYEYFAFGYFEELDVPSFGRVGVMMDDLYLYPIPEKMLSPEINLASVITDYREDINTPQTNVNTPQETPESNTYKPPPIKEFIDEKDSTKVRVKFNIKVQQPRCKLSVYDHGTEDGDIVTLKLNNQEIVKHLKIRRRPNVANFEVELQEGDNFVYPIAENLGRIPPNTIQVIVNCESEEQSFRLFSRPGQSEALRIEL